MIITDAAYMAGLFDGEGCIEITKRLNTSKNYSYSIRITIRMTNRKTIEFITNITKVGHSKEDKVYEGWKKPYRWYAGGKDAIYVLQTILPFLKNKKEEAMLAIEFQSKFPQKQGKSVTEEMNSYREEYYLSMKQLKHRN